MNKRGWFAVGIGLWYAASFAAPPPKIPGEDISESYNTLSRLSDTSVLAPPPTSPHSPLWLETAAKTWDAPSLNQQIEEDATMVPVGKGAIFIPRFSEPALEPTVQINDPNGKLYKWGETGKKYTVLPGAYSVVLGSGSVNQRIFKKITVEEGNVAPLMPDWCGLTVDVVDESNIPFRGPYELARIDELEAYGRSYGRDLTLGERIKTWILKPGLYKIFTAGGSYNALTNFITVRLVPGEFVRVIVIENQKDLKVIGGGVVNTGALSARRKSNWNRNLNVGGTITFNATNDRITPDNTSKATTITFLTLYDLIYKKGPNDWETNIFWNEGLNFSDYILSNINYTGDQFRIISLWVWRVILPWLGPYCRMELQTHFFPVYMRFDNNAKNHFFIVLTPDSTVHQIDSTHSSMQSQPVFSPITIDAGIGTNIDAITRDNYDAKLRVGIGYLQMNVWSQKYQRDSSYIKPAKVPPADSTQLKNALMRNYFIVQESKYILSQSYGPEFGLALNLRAGGWGIARGDFRMRIPIDPLINLHQVRPDFDVNTTLSWSLTHSITIDYLFQYALTHAPVEDANVDLSSHSIFLRFSFNSR